MFSKGLYTREDILGQTYFEFDYETFREHVKNDELYSGYYDLLEIFGEETE